MKEVALDPIKGILGFTVYTRPTLHKFNTAQEMYLSDFVIYK